MLFPDIAHWNLPAVAVGDCGPEDALAQEDSLGMVPKSVLVESLGEGFGNAASNGVQESTLTRFRRRMIALRGGVRSWRAQKQKEYVSMPLPGGETPPAARRAYREFFLSATAEPARGDIAGSSKSRNDGQIRGRWVIEHRFEITLGKMLEARGDVHESAEGQSHAQETASHLSERPLAS
jgi:hypothetical protein